MSDFIINELKHQSLRKSKMKNINLNVRNSVVLTRNQMKNIIGGVKQFCFQCACQSTQNEWGCISIDGCETTGDSLCPNDYRCTTVSCDA